MAEEELKQGIVEVTEEEDKEEEHKEAEDKEDHISIIMITENAIFATIMDILAITVQKKGIGKDGII